MKLGMIGLGRMGANMVQRLLRAGHECVVYDPRAEVVQALAAHGAAGATTLPEFVAKLSTPRVVWLMVPAGAVDQLLAELRGLLAPGDTVIDGGNSYYRDDVRRAKELGAQGVHYVDAGTSGGIWGLEKGYCLMIGGEDAIVQALDPIFAALAPGPEGVPALPGREGATDTAVSGYLHCGPVGAGHFVKMVHNGIEYGLMAAYAEGFNILRNADIGTQEHATDAETTPLRDPDAYRYSFDLARVAEVWRRGSVIRSWLLDLVAGALLQSPDLAEYAGHVADSGEGRWTIAAAIDEGIPAPVLSAALYARFSSRGNDLFADQLLSAMRLGFGGHVEQRTPTTPEGTKQ